MKLNSSLALLESLGCFTPGQMLTARMHCCFGQMLFACMHTCSWCLQGYSSLLGCLLGHLGLTSLYRSGLRHIIHKLGRA